MEGNERGKLPGKSEFSGRRRAVTRKAGYHAHPDSTGGEFKDVPVAGMALRKGERVRVAFRLPPSNAGEWIGFGCWLSADSTCEVEFKVAGVPKKRMTTLCAPDWTKAGSMWLSSGEEASAEIVVTATKNTVVAVWEPECGVIEHDHLGNARAAILGNMYLFAPEGNFYSRTGETVVEGPAGVGQEVPLRLKSCNRCARFLPVNIHDERAHLSFSNHCVAAHRRPCSHLGFGRLTNVETGEELQLEYGFQLECRFCKKFEVNAAHNPQRTLAQMKEDAQRRRVLEELLAELYGESPILRYRHLTGRELPDDLITRFEGRCFHCGEDVTSNWHLDHTRPLSLFWPVDGTATLLCGNCNSAKRDRSPVDFYSTEQLERLSGITGVSLDELRDPNPNIEAVRLLRDRLDWFFDTFLARPELARTRDGKVGAELLVKAIQKVINACPVDERFDIAGEFERRRG